MSKKVVRAQIDSEKRKGRNRTCIHGAECFGCATFVIDHGGERKKLPFELLVPNEETITAMRQARKSGLKRFDSVDALMDDLRAR